MATVFELFVRLVESAVRLPIEIGEIALQNPASFLSVAVGSVFVLGASAALGYLVVGAVAELVGVQIPTPGKGPREGPERIPTERPNPNFEQEGASGAARAKRQE